MTPDDKKDDEARPALSPKKKITFLFVLLLVLLALAEGLLQLLMVDVEIRRKPRRGGFLVPYRAGAEADLLSPDFRVRYRINERGFRDRPGRALARPEGRRRVMILGDSFSEGYGVALEETYAYRLEEAGVGEVWNLSCMGNAPLFYVLRAREWAPKLAPDLVVIQLFDNDPQENSYRKIGFRKDGGVEALPSFLKPDSGPGASLRDIVDASALRYALVRLGKRLEGKPLPRLFVKPGSGSAPATEGPPERRALGDAVAWYDPSRFTGRDINIWDAAFDRHEALLRQLFAELRALPSKPAIKVVYIPHIVFLEAYPKLADYRAKNRHWRALARICQDEEVPLIDATEVVLGAGRPPAAFYHPRDWHWNADGHALFAKAAEPRLR